MAKMANSASVAHQVELIIAQLDSLSTLPELMAGFLSQLADAHFDIPAVTQIIESDPALTAKIFSLAYQEGIISADSESSVADIIEKLPRETIRDAALSVKVLQTLNVDGDPGSEQFLTGQQLRLHALAVACCAKEIAELALPENQRRLAFTAGLLHDIGKLAIDEVMPKSFEKMSRQAKVKNTSICRIEKEHLGLDHTIIGKRLAEKWRFPKSIVLAIWLHHSDTQAITENIGIGGIAEVVRLADIIARQCNIGMSGSFDTPDFSPDIVEPLSLSTEQIDRVRKNLRQEISRRSNLLGLEAPGGKAAYCELIQETAAQLAQDNSKLTFMNRKLATSNAHMACVKEFLLNVRPNNSAIDIAGNIASNWQKHYQTGPICIFLQDSRNEEFLESIVIDIPSQINRRLLKAPVDIPAIPLELQNKFAIMDADNSTRWILEQIDFDVSMVKMAPLLSEGRAIGAIVFKQRIPVDPAEQLKLFEISASIGATIIDMVLASHRQEFLAEQFAGLLGQVKQTRGQLAAVKTLAGIAEVAAGAGHELNNPLAVISGRAQLLYDGETEDKKKQVLKQIQDRTSEISEIVTDLMDFARPKQPTPEKVSVKTLLNQAVEQTAKKHKLNQMEVELIEIDGFSDVYVDREQIITAIVNILSNSLESYREGYGPVKIDSGCEQIEGSVSFRIVDNGLGMDIETLQKATLPFFSAPQAGRKRGMGLAHAERLVRLNNGTINMISNPDEGTTVNITLPEGQ